ncbi:MAG: formylglycine-generating enzyme family protein [Roseomonas sp.]|nr:formylglycine-generating enzyme family protein [Roseomonas sp.]MCA3328011.1 formylglycine-generating enzyme family protein [Roseomonas sp.]MCA3332896.1 formylglycine-generating enzyme family protein [Roseomonas sp.]MCA3335029.1 formylglycine-generating enzyme family protein [Roseomonas sp.]MCA3347373.1 formylglycine-generating enzyme family protein [Roseomonas sp.]
MIKDAARESLARIMAEPSESFVALARASGLDPATGWRGADLRSVDFGTDDLTGFRFPRTLLHGADLSQARGLRRDMFQYAGWDETTRFPPDLHMPLSQLRPPLEPLARWREPIPGLPERAWPDMVTLPAGTFLMGAPKAEKGSQTNERPQRRVTVPRPFALGRTAVTFAMWDAAMAAGFVPPSGTEPPKDAGWGRDERPVINVSWHDAQAYCTWLNQRLGLPPGTYRLPSEAEWEYSCRAGRITPFSFGKKILPEQANYNGSYSYEKAAQGEFCGRTVPVGSLPANPWGLHEMHGNVSEWVEDAYCDYPAYATDASPLVYAIPSQRVLRGGSWTKSPEFLRSWKRGTLRPVGRSSSIGFRVARTLD